MVEPLFLFGAGACRPFGIPTMKEMVTQFRKELSEIKVEGIDDEVKLYDDIESTLREEFGATDLESVFTVVDAFAQEKRSRSDYHVLPSSPWRLGLDTLAQIAVEAVYAFF